MHRMLTLGAACLTLVLLAGCASTGGNNPPAPLPNCPPWGNSWDPSCPQPFPPVPPMPLPPIPHPPVHH